MPNIELTLKKIPKTDILHKVAKFRHIWSYWHYPHVQLNLKEPTCLQAFLQEILLSHLFVNKIFYQDGEMGLDEVVHVCGIHLSVGCTLNCYRRRYLNKPCSNLTWLCKMTF